MLTRRFITESRRKGRLAQADPLQIRWGPLVVLEKVGRGSFGDVYRAWDPRLDREVALKLIPEEASEAAGSPVVEEGRLLARVRHPNVLTVHGAERIDGRAGIWTEYVRGKCWPQEVARRGPLPADEAARIGADVCGALAAVHAAGLLHRDVKAQNVLRDATGRIVLGDFGTGVPFDEQAGVSDPQVAGTPLYLAPEVIEGRPATTRSVCTASVCCFTSSLPATSLCGVDPSGRSVTHTGMPVARRFVRVVQTCLNPCSRRSSAR